MRYLLPVLLLCFYLTDVQAQDKKSYSTLNQYLDEEHAKDSTYYPSLSMSEELKTKLQKAACYPDLAIKRKMQKFIRFKLTVDTAGKLKDLMIDEEANPLFDTNAIRLLMASSGYWKPAIRNNRKEECKITTYVKYRLFRSTSGTLYYTVGLMGLEQFLLDSAKNSPPVLLLTDKAGNKEFYINEKQVDGEKVTLADQYGTVTVGFDVDTNGHLSNIAVVNSVTTELDEDALKFIRSTEGKWLPAAKDGAKREAHVEFDLNYYQYTKALFSPGLRVLAHAYDRDEAKKFFEEKNYKSALTRLKRLRRYYIHDPEIFFMRGFSYLNMKEMEKACEDISYSLFLAEEYGYPATMNKEKITEFVNTYCNQEAEQTDEGK